MRLQLLSDLHLESEPFDPAPAPGAELLVLAGDIDSTWQGLDRFVDWPVPVLFVAGNHEFDGRDVDEAWPALRERCDRLGLVLLEREQWLWTDSAGCRVRFLGTVRWSDFDLYGPSGRARAERAAGYYLRLMGASRGGHPFDAAQVREQAQDCRRWLADELGRASDGHWDKTVVITHFAPSLRSMDPRYGAQPGTASFCNADDELLPAAHLWLHGHLHCRYDYRVGETRVVSQARGHVHKGEVEGFDPGRLIVC